MNVKKCKLNIKHVVLILFILFSIIMQWKLINNFNNLLVCIITSFSQILFAIYLIIFFHINKKEANKKIIMIEKENNALREQIEGVKGRAKKFINNIDDILLGIVISENGKCIYTNKECVKILHGENVMQIVGTRFLDYIEKNERKKVEELFNNISPMNTGEYKIIGIDGELAYVQVVTFPHEIDGTEKALSIIIDISEKKIIEERKLFLEQAMEEEKLQLEQIANLSHEFSTPINVILNAVQLNQMYLNMDKINIKSYMENLNIIKTNSFRLNRTISNILDMVKIKMGYFDMHIENKNIVEVIENIVDKVVPLVKERGKNIIFDTDVEEKITGVDEEKIERVMLNLITNGVKYTGDNGKIKIEIKSGQQQVVIRCKDNGIGIPKEKMDILFNNFKQIDKSLNRCQEGVGVGLALSKEIINLHGGTMEAKSTYGTGSEFIIKLPIKLVEEQEEKWNRIYRGLDTETVDIEFSDIASKDIIEEYTKKY